MQQLAIDMDEVLADTLSRHLAWYVRDHGPGLTPAALHGLHIADAVPAEHRDRTRDYPNHPDFFRNLPVMPGAAEVVLQLAARYELFVASAATEYPNSFGPKFEWLRQHFAIIPPSHIVFCGDKSVLGTDYLLDDSPRHFARFRGVGVIFSAPHNLAATGYQRVANWAEVARLFLSDHAEPGAAPDSGRM